MSELLVQDLMSTDLFTLFVDDQLEIAEELMKWRAFRHVPVVDDAGAIVGLITHRDVLQLSLSKQAQAPVGKVMQKELCTVTPETNLSTAARLLIDNKFGCLPVVDENKKLVGIVTEADFVKIYART